MGLLTLNLTKKRYIKKKFYKYLFTIPQGKNTLPKTDWRVKEKIKKLIDSLTGFQFCLENVVTNKFGNLYKIFAYLLLTFACPDKFLGKFLENTQGFLTDKSFREENKLPVSFIIPHGKIDRPA